jgi:hypothetical protein
MHRPTVGLIAIVLLGTALALWIIPSGLQSHQALLGACLKVGAVMGALWLAHPQLMRLPKWMAAAAGITAVVAAVKPRILFVAVPLLFIVWSLMPSAAKRNSITSRGRQPSDGAPDRSKA